MEPTLSNLADAVGELQRRSSHIHVHADFRRGHEAPKSPPVEVRLSGLVLTREAELSGADLALLASVEQQAARLARRLRALDRSTQ